MRARGAADDVARNDGAAFGVDVGVVVGDAGVVAVVADGSARTTARGVHPAASVASAQTSSSEPVRRITPKPAMRALRMLAP